MDQAAVEGKNDSRVCFAKVESRRHYCVEHRLRILRRLANCPKDLGRRSFLLDRFGETLFERAKS
jgi:hypothetical protein